MKAQATIHHQLALVVRLIDATTGRGISERDVRFRLDPVKIKPIARGGGTYLFLDVEKEDFTMEVSVYGYEPCEMEIRFSALDSRMPIQEFYLLPLDNLAEGENVLTLRGTMPGIEAIEAVPPSGTTCSIKDYDKRKKIMTVFNPHNARLSDIHYGLVSLDRCSYEPFQVAEEIGARELRLREDLQQPFTINQPIARILYGQVKPDGSYLLKVRDSKNAVYLVRYVVDGRERFQAVDFHKPEPLDPGEPQIGG